MKPTKEEWKAFKKAKECHICKKDLIRRNEKDQIEVWDPKTGEYFGKVHKYKKAPLNSPVSCYKEVMELIATDENGKFIKEWHSRAQKLKKKALEENPEEDNCYYCNQPLLREKFRDAVMDHCDITGEIRGAAHNACNLKLKINPKTTTIPVVFHNLRGYDAHHLMQEIAAFDANIRCIPNNMEKYISFSLGNLRFIDSYQFLLSSCKGQDIRTIPFIDFVIFML